MNKTNMFLLPAVLAIVLRPVLAIEVRREIHFPDLEGYQTIDWSVTFARWLVNADVIQIADPKEASCNMATNKEQQ